MLRGVSAEGEIDRRQQAGASMHEIRRLPRREFVEQRGEAAGAGSHDFCVDMGLLLRKEPACCDNRAVPALEGQFIEFDLVARLGEIDVKAADRIRWIVRLPERQSTRLEPQGSVARAECPGQQAARIEIGGLAEIERGRCEIGVKARRSRS